MSIPRRSAFGDWALAIALWLLLAFSLGWYYTFTFYGKWGWPMPSVEGCGGLILYYFSVLNVRTEIQAVHWMLVFPVAGVMWVALLTLTAPAFQARTELLPWPLLLFALPTLPLSLPAPVLVYLAGRTRDGWDWRHMIDVALRRGHVTPDDWLTPLYLGLGLVALAWHIQVYRHVFEITGKAAWKHFSLTAAVYVLVMAGLGGVVSVPLLYWIEGTFRFPGL